MKNLLNRETVKGIGQVSKYLPLGAEVPKDKAPELEEKLKESERKCAEL